MNNSEELVKLAQQSAQSDALLGAVLIALLTVLIFPIFKEWLKNRKARINLLHMLTADIEDRLKTYNEFEFALQHAIHRMQQDDQFLPVLTEIPGLDGYIDWVEEKWLLPPGQSGDILRFYNLAETFKGLVVFTHSTQYHDMPHERKIKVFEKIQEELKSACKQGTTLLLLLQSDGF